MESQALPPVEQSDRDRPPDNRSRKWRWWLLVGLVTVLFHSPILRALGNVLTVAPAPGPHDVAVILGGEHRLQAVAELLSANQVERVWIFEGPPGYLEEAGILPSGATTAVAQLTEAGVSASAIDVFSNDDLISLADTARAVASRLRQQPQTRVLLVCGALDGRRVRLAFDDVLGEPSARQISVLGLPYDDIDVQQWWKSRSGLKQVFGQVCAIGFTLAMGTGPRDAPARVDPEVIEHDLQEQFGEVACYEF